MAYNTIMCPTKTISCNFVGSGKTLGKTYKNLCGKNQTSVGNLWRSLNEKCGAFPLLVHTYKETAPPKVDPAVWLGRYYDNVF